MAAQELEGGSRGILVGLGKLSMRPGESFVRFDDPVELGHSEHVTRPLTDRGSSQGTDSPETTQHTKTTLVT